MKPEWMRACRGAGMTVQGDFIDVPLGHEGRHRVHLLEEDDMVRLTAVVQRAVRVEHAADLEADVLDRNRASRLVGYRLDDRGRLVGEALLPAAGLEGEEIAFRLKVLAADCNRFEYALTGGDVE